MTIYHVFEAIFVLHFVKLVPVVGYSIWDVFLRRFLRRVYDDIPMFLDTLSTFCDFGDEGDWLGEPAFFSTGCTVFVPAFVRDFSAVSLKGFLGVFFEHFPLVFRRRWRGGVARRMAWLLHTLNLTCRRRYLVIIVALLWVILCFPAFRAELYFFCVRSFVTHTTTHILQGTFVDSRFLFRGTICSCHRAFNVCYY